MANKRIIEQTASTTISNDDWFVKDSPTGGTTKILTSLLRTLLGGDNFASTYDSSLTYYAGNMCIYNGILYKCKAFSETTGTFDSSKWTQVTITDYASKLLASDWRATSSYVRDDLVSYRGSIYRCASDSATVGTFVDTEWITANWDSIKIVLLRNNIAKKYDGSEIYNKGDLVFESPYYLCVCKENGVTGAFDTSKWITDGTISDALELVDEQIIENIAGEYDSEVEYSKDALCFKDGVLYIANADTTGTWDSTKWNATTIADIIANLRIDANDVVDVKVKGYSLVNSSKIAVLDSLTAQGSASGSIASFSDGSTHPMSKLEVGIDPIQDLHGYDSPWAGGAGKNKLQVTATSQTIAGVTVTVNDDGTFVVNGTVTQNISLQLSRKSVNDTPLPEGQLIMTGCPSGGSTSSYYLTCWRTNSGNANDVGNGITFSYLSDWDFVVSLVIISGTACNNLTFKPMIRLASVQDATFAPYSNICPISGWSEANVSVCGVNVWDEDWELGYIDSQGNNTTSRFNIRSKNYIPIEPNTTYYLKSGYTTVVYCPIFYYDSNKVFLSANLQQVWNTVITTPPNANYIRFYMNSAYGDVYNNDISINYPSTDTEYHAYNGHTYNVEFKDGSNPLTVYGGTLDVLSGVLTVDRVSVDLGTLNWVYSENANVFGSNQFTPYVLTNGKLTCSQYKWNSTPNVSPVNLNNGEISASPYFNRQTVMVKDTRYTDATSFKTAMNGVQLVYELDTPITYQLTPTQVKSLLGMNNVWADTGDVNEAVYTRDLNTTVNDIISRIEALENA